MQVLVLDNHYLVHTSLRHSVLKTVCCCCFILLASPAQENSAVDQGEQSSVTLAHHCWFFLPEFTSTVIVNQSGVNSLYPELVLLGVPLSSSASSRLPCWNCLSISMVSDNTTLSSTKPSP